MLRSTSAKTAFLGATLLTACSAKPIGSELAAPEPVFDVKAFFLGRTEGKASLKIVFKAPAAIHVQGQGHIDADGALILDQVINRAEHKPERRQWRFRQISANRFSGTLTGATGPVVGEVTGNTLHLGYSMKGGLRVEQWLYLQPGGRTALNRMQIHKFGLPVGHLEETIRKLD